MTDAIENQEDIKAFRLAHELAVRIYRLTLGFPAQEKYGLASQMRKSAAAIPANIAEGYSRMDRKEFKDMVGRARSANSEINYQLKLAHELKIIGKKEYDELSVKYFIVGRMLGRLYRALSRVPVMVNS